MADPADDLSRKISEALDDANAVALEDDDDVLDTVPEDKVAQADVMQDLHRRARSNNDDSAHRASMKRKSSGRRPKTSPVSTMQTSPIRRSATHAQLGGRSTLPNMRRSKSRGGMRRAQSTPSGMRRASSSRSMKRTTSWGTAGYVAPDSEVDDNAMEKAQQIAKDKRALRRLLSDNNIRASCDAVGIVPKDLMPRSLASFRHEEDRAMVLPKDKQRKRFNHFENRRLWKLAVVLTNAQQRDKKPAISEKELQNKSQQNLAAVFKAAVYAEKNRVKKIKQARQKVVGVLTRENELLRMRRREFNERSNVAEERDRRVRMTREQQRAELQARAAQRQKDIERVKKVRSARDQQRILEVMHQTQERDARIAEFLEIRDAEKSKFKEDKAAMQAKRQQMRDQKKAREEARRAQLREAIQEKGALSELLSAERQRQIDARSEERRLQQKTRMENAARVRRIAANEKLKAQRKMEAAYARMEHMNEVRAAIDEARREAKKREIIASDRWKLETTLERAITPGPGEYNLDAGPKGPKGGTWGKHKPKSDVEWKIYRAAQIPGPGQYKLPSSVLVPGGTWGKHKPKSDVEWQMYRAAQIPGPGEYRPRALKSGVAVKFGNHNPPSDLDRAIRKARDLPGPGAYAPPVTPSPRKSLKQLKRVVSKIEVRDD